MPYATNTDLLDRIRLHLPERAQDIFWEAFNCAWDCYAASQKRYFSGTRETAAIRVAWTTVKRLYKKNGGIWISLSGKASSALNGWLL